MSGAGDEASAAAAPEVGGVDIAPDGVESRCRRMNSTVLRRGWTLGMKVAIAGAVGPPVVLLSVFGVALSLPFAIYLASLTGTDKLMSCLLPLPPKALDSDEPEAEDEAEEEDEEEEEAKERENGLVMKEKQLVQELGFREGRQAAEALVDDQNGGSASESFDFGHSPTENGDLLQITLEENFVESTEEMEAQMESQLQGLLLGNDDNNSVIEIVKEAPESEGVVEIEKEKKEDDLYDALLDKEESGSTEYPLVDEKLTFVRIEDDTVDGKVQENNPFEESQVKELKGLMEEEAEAAAVLSLQSVVCVLEECNDQSKCVQNETQIDIKNGVQRHEDVESVGLGSSGVKQEEAIGKEEEGLNSEAIKNDSGEIMNRKLTAVEEEGMMSDSEDILGFTEKKTKEQSTGVAIYKKKPLFDDIEEHNDELTEDEPMVDIKEDILRENEANEVKKTGLVVTDEEKGSKKEEECLTPFFIDNNAEEIQLEGIKGVVMKNTEEESTVVTIYVHEEHDNQFNSTEDDVSSDARGYIQTDESIQLVLKSVSTGEKMGDDGKKEYHLIKNDISESKLQDDNAVEKLMLFESTQLKELGGNKSEEHSSAAIHELHPVVYALEQQNNQVKNSDDKYMVDVRGDNHIKEVTKEEGSVQNSSYLGGREAAVTGKVEEAMNAAICEHDKTFIALMSEEDKVEISLFGLSSEDSTMNDENNGHVHLFQEMQSSVQTRSRSEGEIAEEMRKLIHPDVAESEHQDPLRNYFTPPDISSETKVGTQQGILSMEESLVLKQTAKDGNMVKRNFLETKEAAMMEKKVSVGKANEVALVTPGPEKRRAKKSKESFNENDYVDIQIKVREQNILDDSSVIKDQSLENINAVSLSSTEPLLELNTQIVAAAPDEGDFPPLDNEVLYSEEMLWKQVHAMRIIIGYNDSLRSLLVEELKALYLFTGVEPPEVFKDNSDLMDLAVKLQFLKAVIGIE